MKPTHRHIAPKRLLPRLAVALRHDLGSSDAPRVVASGRGSMAERLIELAQKHSVPVQQDESLAKLLSEVEVHSVIPPELFEAVARVLAFIYRVDGRLSRN